MYQTNEIYQTNEKFFNNKDVFLASFPRSGNTWMRLLLSDLILQIQGFSTDTGGNIIPDVYRVDIEEWNRDSRINQLPFRIIKTHEPYQDCYSKVIYIFRKPADSLCSLYHYMLDRSQQFIDENPRLDEFCCTYLDLWCRHLETYIQSQEKNIANILFLSYEKIKDHPSLVLQFVANFIGLEVTLPMCNKAVENQAFKNLKSLAKLEEPSILGFSEEGGYKNFFRKGKLNSAKDELSVQTLEFIESKTLTIYKQAKALETVS